jgi:hypothetical protein
MRRRLWLVAVTLLLLSIGAHAVYWRWTERRLAEGTAAWFAERRAAGWTARAGTAAASGWPLAATLTLPNVSLEGGEPDIPGGVAWAAERAILRISLLNPRMLSIDAEGMQSLRIGHVPAVPYTADRLQATLPLGPAPVPHSAEVLATNIRAGMPPTKDKDAARGLTIGLLRAHLEWRFAAPQGEPALGFAVACESVGLPPGVRWPLGSRVSSVSVEGALDGPVPRNPGLAQRASGWRDGGGTLAIDRLALGWGPLGLSASATMALDEQLQPMGTANARLVGYAEALDVLAANGVITRRAGAAAQAVLALIARSEEEGGPAEVEVPLTLQDRTLSMRQIPLLRMPMLVWPPG